MKTNVLCIFENNNINLFNIFLDRKIDVISDSTIESVSMEMLPNEYLFIIICVFVKYSKQIYKYVFITCKI